MIADRDCVVSLFVPGHRPERFEKAAASGADVVILDLEDAVPPDAKDTARAALRADFTALPVVVRIDALGAPGHAADLAALAGHGFAAVMLPKAEPSEAFAAFAAAAPLPVVALVETARGIAGARAIAATANVARLAFGSIDFAADLGCAHTREALLTARAELVLASRLAGLPPPLDGVTTALEDADLAEADARHARDLGFAGKLAIHPRQIAPIRRGFAPDAADVAWARRVLAAAEGESGDGAARVDGAMVDRPVRLRAAAILRRVGG